MSRLLEPLPTPTGPGVLGVLDRLRRALDGAGPALLPLPADDPAAAGRLSAALQVGSALPPAEDPPGNPTALVIATSGSTGEAKGVLLGAAALRASAESTHARLGGPGRWLLALPAWHIAGMQVLVRSLLGGRPPVVLDLAAGFRPDAYAAAAADVLADSGPRYTSLVPTQLGRLLAEGGAGLAALRGFDAVLLGGAALPQPLRERAEAAGVRLVTTYGMSETAGGCVYDRRPLTGVRISLGPETGAESDSARVASRPGDELADFGTIRLAGPMLATGYRQRPAETAAAFRNGWFETGDLGRLDVDGRLDVLGRADELINTGGVKVAPVLVERALTGVPGVLEACVLGMPDPEWGEAVVAAVVPVDPADPPQLAELHAAVRAAVGARAVPKTIRFLPRLPLRGPGKVDRHALRSVLTKNAEPLV